MITEKDEQVLRSMGIISRDADHEGCVKHSMTERDERERAEGAGIENARAYNELTAKYKKHIRACQVICWILIVGWAGSLVLVTR